MRATRVSALSRRGRRIARILAASWLLLGIGSCAAVLDLDHYQSAAAEMCDLLGRCYEEKDYPACQTRLEGHLSAGLPSARVAWLTQFTNHDCLESCNAGRTCLDIAPLCEVLGAPCEHPRDCCGSLGGHASCETTCCKTRGSACSPSEPCCNSDGACIDFVCGGRPCTEAPDRCAKDEDCCTRICKKGRCAATVCNEDKFQCSVDKDCCSGFCDPGSSLCAAPPVCAKAGEPCAIETDCCPETHCSAAPGTIARACAKADCSLALVDCATDDQCCSGRCDRATFSCAPACTYEGSACGADSDCCAGQCVNGACAGTCSTSSCTASEDCCSGSCVQGTCAAPCSPVSTHDPCTPGGPLARSTDLTSCIDMVCNDDPFCCCGAWDELCVAAALGLKKTCTEICQ
jgi:hypothetical protein